MCLKNTATNQEKNLDKKLTAEYYSIIPHLSNTDQFMYQRNYSKQIELKYDIITLTKYDIEKIYKLNDNDTNR